MLQNVDGTLIKRKNDPKNYVVCNIAPYKIDTAKFSKPLKALRAMAWLVRTTHDRFIPGQP